MRCTEQIYVKTFKAILLSVLFMAVPGYGSPELSSRLGAELKILSSPTGLGVLFGWRYLFHSSPLFSIGGAGATGQTGSGAASSYSYGGMVAAFHIPFTPLSSMEVSFLGGGGGGRAADGSAFGGTVVEPALGFAFQLGRSVQFVASGSYVWMPSSTQGSGITGGVKFEFLIDHRSELTPREPRMRPMPSAPSSEPSSAPSSNQSSSSRSSSSRGTASSGD